MSTIAGSSIADAGILMIPDTVLHAAVSPADPYITVEDASGWPVAKRDDAKTYFYIKVADTAAGAWEFMKVTETVGSTWTVTRGQEYSSALDLPKGARVSHADRCQWVLDSQNWHHYRPYAGLIYASATEPTVPCASDMYIIKPSSVLAPIAPSQHPFVVQVANSGSFDLSGVTVSWPVPTNAVFYGASVSQGSYTNTLVNVSFNLGLLQVGETADIGISFQPKTSGTVIHEFNLSADQPLLGQTYYQVTNIVSIKPVLSIAKSTNQTVTVSWPTNDAWTLQQNSNVNSGWMNAPFQTSPSTVPADQPKQFYRLTR